MEFPKQIMKMSELKELGFPIPLLMEAYRDPKQNFATKIDPSKPNSKIIFDTVGFDKWIAKSIVRWKDGSLSELRYRLRNLQVKEEGLQME